MREPGICACFLTYFFDDLGYAHAYARSHELTSSSQVKFKIARLADSTMRWLRGLNRLLQYAHFGVRFGHFLLRL